MNRWKRLAPRSAHYTNGMGLEISNRKIQILLLGVVLVPLALLFAAVWHYSNVIEARGFRVDHEPEPFDLLAMSLETGRITLSTTSDTPSDDEWNRPGIWGLKSLDTYNQVSGIVAETGDSVTRELTVLSRPPETPAPVLLDPYAYPGDPLVAHGIEFTEVEVSAPLGDFPAWLTDGDSDTWVILIHGQGSSREQFLRIIPTLVESGHPTLTITYRNDRDVPASPSGYYGFGTEEWEELEDAVAFALSAGARDVVLVGYSMGGAIAVNFMYSSALSTQVRGLILDSPALHFDRTIDFGGSQERVLGVALPGLLTSLAKVMTTLRFGIDYSAMNHLDRVGELPSSVPVLLLHGSDDTSVPVSISEDFAEARPDIVEYHVLPGAMHVRLWNHDPRQYEAILRDFLLRLRP